jgi:phosphoenolpyruvate-protein phosphotransferase/dihydroxyacetone kinase phosphotransfer subunit
MTPPSGAGALGVGIVVVSHSRALATAAVALATEMLHGAEPRIAIAAGLDETTFGTDAVQIAAAIEQVDSDAGVVVLMDLGSAVLSAELALDLLDDDAVRDRALLCPAPLVEGLVVAAVAAAGGASRVEVAAEARGALLGKSAHLMPEETPAATEVEAGASVASFTVGNPHGLHARPAARLVGEVRRLDATVTVRNVTTGSGPVPADSLSRVATLGALQGHVVEIAASGRQAQTALDHVLALARRRFDEPDGAVPVTPEVEVATGTPMPAAPGIGMGPARRLPVAPVVVTETPAGPPAFEWRRLVESVADVRRDIERVRATAVLDTDEAGIFDAHLMLLEDAELVGAARARIDGGASAAGAWAAAAAALEQQWAALPDPYLRARAADVRAVAGQVLRALAGEVGVPPAVVDGVLVAWDLTPAQAAALDSDRVSAVVLAGGSATSHAAILVRSLGIPAVVAAGPAVLEIREGTPLVVDGSTGRLVVDPARDEMAAYEREVTRLAALRARNVAEAARPAATVDGVLIEVTANLGSVTDARAAVAAGADGAGLIRTEFLFLDRELPPSADEQEAEYRGMAEAFGGRPITLRTLDVGGDKPLRYLRQDAEANPFLGLRGLRLSLARPGLLAEQLEAICRLARSAPVKVMFPMVTTVDELLTARGLLEEVAGRDGLPPRLRVGMMVEVPAAALNIEAFLPHVDFVSIGTNDLTQYTLAVERGNAAVAALADPLDPGVLRLVAEVGRRAAGRAAVSVCGEAASDPLAVPVLLGLGVTELSVSPGAVPAVKAAVRALDLRSCADLAERCLRAAGAAEVRRLVGATEEWRPRPDTRPTLRPVRSVSGGHG